MGPAGDDLSAVLNVLSQIVCSALRPVCDEVYFDQGSAVGRGEDDLDGGAGGLVGLLVCTEKLLETGLHTDKIHLVVLCRIGSEIDVEHNGIGESEALGLEKLVDVLEQADRLLLGGRVRFPIGVEPTADVKRIARPHRGRSSSWRGRRTLKRDPLNLAVGLRFRLLPHSRSNQNEKANHRQSNNSQLI